MVTEQMIKIVADRLKDNVQKIKTHLTNLESDIADLEKLSNLCQIENKQILDEDTSNNEQQLDEAGVKIMAEALSENDEYKLKKGFEKALGITPHKSHEEKNFEKILASAAANGTKVIGVPPGGGMVIGVGSDMEVGMHPIDAFPKVKNVPKVHNFYNDDVKAKQGGSTISNKFNKEIDKITNFYLYDHIYDDKRFTQVLKDIMAIEFDLENFAEFQHEECRGYKYIAVQAGGDWEYPVWFFIYHTGTNFKGYIPTRGNAINTINKSAFGNEENDDKKYLKQYGHKEPQDDYVNYEECKKEFECRVGLREVDSNGIPKEYLVGGE